VREGADVSMASMRCWAPDVDKEGNGEGENVEMTGLGGGRLEVQAMIYQARE
jgi:hypothetical protein